MERDDRDAKLARPGPRAGHPRSMTVEALDSDESKPTRIADLISVRFHLRIIPGQPSDLLVGASKITMLTISGWNPSIRGLLQPRIVRVERVSNVSLGEP